MKIRFRHIVRFGLRRSASFLNEHAVGMFVAIGLSLAADGAEDINLFAAIEGAVAELVADGTYAAIAEKYPDIVNNLLFLQ